jgi:hypothetical protein
VREMERCSELTLLKTVHLKLKETCVQAQPESSGTQGPVQTQSRDVLGASRRLLLYPRAGGVHARLHASQHVAPHAHVENATQNRLIAKEALMDQAQVVASYLFHQEGMNVMVEPDVHDVFARLPGYGFM